MDAIQKLIDMGLRVDCSIVTGWWKDTGTPRDILDANRLLLDHKYLGKTIRGLVEGRVYIDEGAIVLLRGIRLLM